MNEPEDEKIENTDIEKPETVRVRQVKSKIKERKMKERIESWKPKPLHGQFIKEAQKEHVDKQLTWNWLRGGSRTTSKFFDTNIFSCLELL